ESFEGLPEDLTLNGLVYFKYAPITSVDVERSFSIYKNMLTNNRRAFKFDDIRKCLIVQSNFTGEDEENETDHTQTFLMKNSKLLTNERLLCLRKLHHCSASCELPSADHGTTVLPFYNNAGPIDIRITHIIIDTVFCKRLSITSCRPIVHKGVFINAPKRVNNVQINGTLRHSRNHNALFMKY
ncbi:Uncharacterized protein FWK35_00033984, partial [Aphis craccivora]